MPVIQDRESYECWLTGASDEAAALMGGVGAHPAGALGQ